MNEEIAHTVQEFKTTKQLVEHYLAISDRAKNDDKFLTWAVFNHIAQKYNKNVFIPFELFEKFPAFETVKRMRALIQNKEKKFCPTEFKVIERRQKRRKVIEHITTLI